MVAVLRATCLPAQAGPDFSVSLAAAEVPVSQDFAIYLGTHATAPATFGDLDENWQYVRQQFTTYTWQVGPGGMTIACLFLAAAMGGSTTVGDNVWVCFSGALSPISTDPIGPIDGPFVLLAG